MSGGNQKTRIDFPTDLVRGPIPGEHLFEVFKSEMVKENVFRLMFGSLGERIFTTEQPNLNETILPALILQWRSETFQSNNCYLTGSVSAWIILPTRLKGDYNSLRKVGSIFQRWTAGAMSLFDKVPGLTMFGFGAEYNYDGLVSTSALSAPAIQITLPVKFDLQLMRLQAPYDPTAPLDDSDVGFVEQYLLEVKDGKDQEVIFQQGVLITTGETNI